MCESKRMVRDGQVERGEEAAKADVATHHAATAIQGFDGGSFQDRCECGRGTRTPWGRRTRRTYNDLPWTRTPPAVSIRDTRHFYKSHYQPAHTPPRSPAPDSPPKSYLAGRVQLPVGASSQLSAPIHPYTL